MADIVRIDIPRTVVEENSHFTATAYFRDYATSAADTPTTVRYRIDCMSTRTELVGWTSATPGTSVSITVPAAANNIQDNANRFEHKQITVEADTGLSTQAIGQRTWKTRNIYGISKTGVVA